MARAAKMLAELGPSGLALRQVAAAEGTSTTAIYSMFSDRAGLMLEVGREASRSFLEAQHSVPVTDDPHHDLLAYSQAYRRWALENPTLYQVLLTPPALDMRLHGPLPEAESATPIRAAITRLIESGTFPAVDPNLILASFWAATHGFVALELSRYFDPLPRQQLDRMYDTQVAVITKGWALPA